jgi:fructose-1,6-bisphosphatase class II
MKNTQLDLVRVTESAAIAASYFIGSGDKESADKAAVDAMKNRLNRSSTSFQVAIGEGKKDKSYGIFKGEHYGSYGQEAYDLAIDPIEGTTPTANGGPEAMSVIGTADSGCLFATEEFYMNKLAYGPIIRSQIKLSITDPIEINVQRAAAVTDKTIEQIMVCVLDRPRHYDIIKRLRTIGTRIKLIQDCDVSGAIATCLSDRGIDILYGIGGSPECVIAACAIKCLQGDLQAQLANKDGVTDPKVYELEDLVKGNCTFAASGITDGSLLEGVRFTGRGPVTNSVFMRSESGTVRWLKTYHGN